MISPDKLKGTQVFSARGLKIGTIEGIEIDENNLTLLVEVKMYEDMAKLFGEQAGFLKKKTILIPASKMGPITGKRVTLREELTGPEIQRILGEASTR